MINGLKDKIVETTTGLFSHGPQPMPNTLDYMGDEGLIGPDSVSWPILGDAAAFIGGIRALLVQTAHPEVVAGVEDHSRYQLDPLGRLTRTATYVTETTFGATPEVAAAVEAVRVAHRPVKGRSDRGRPYSADHPQMAAWVHNVLTDSFLKAYQAYGRVRLTDSEADRFVAEQARIGDLLGADPLPETARELTDWIVYHPEIQSTGDQQKAVGFLKDPPLSLPVKGAYKLLLGGAVATIDPKVRKIIGLEPSPGAQQVSAVALNSLRWALGSSPSWHIALVRCGAPIPEGIFRQPLPD